MKDSSVFVQPDSSGRPIRYTSVISALGPSVPFVAPEALERRNGSKILLRLGANESAFGVSPAAVGAMQKVAVETHWYGDPESHELRTALAKTLAVGADNIVIGNGIDGLLGYIVRAFVEPGVHVATSLGTYPTFNYHVLGYGGTLHRIPYNTDRIDLDALLETIRRTGSRLVYIANPDNPSGTWQSAVELLEFIRLLPGSCVAVLDEAYSEFAKPGTIPTIDRDIPNVIRVRTFSKAHGLAGARIGYAIASRQIIETIERFRNQFEVSRISQAGALASLGDLRFVASVVAAVETGRTEYESLARSLGIPTIPSATNFVCFDVGGEKRAEKIVAQLLRQGVFIRMPGAPPLNRCIRVTVGTPEQRAQFGEIFTSIWTVTT